VALRRRLRAVPFERAAFPDAWPSTLWRARRGRARPRGAAPHRSQQSLLNPARPIKKINFKNPCSRAAQG
jgi:hypothetical protein